LRGVGGKKSYFIWSEISQKKKRKKLGRGEIHSKDKKGKIIEKKGETALTLEMTKTSSMKKSPPSCNNQSEKNCLAHRRGKGSKTKKYRIGKKNAISK